MDTQRGRIEYAESRRGALATVGGVLLAAGLAGLLAVGKVDEWTYFPAWLGLVSATAGLVLTGVTVIAIYGRQTNWSYPFKRLSKTWKHFYRDALPGADNPAAPWHCHQSKTFKLASERGFEAIREIYINHALALADPSVSLAQDIEQSHLLHWNEMYKNRFLTSLRKVLVRGIIASLAAGLIGFGIGLAVAPHEFDDHFRHGSTASPTQ